MIAYAPQNPWIMDKLVRENVLLGCKHNLIKYASVIGSCRLDVDLAQHCDGKNPIAGNRGVQLSGGQRARITLGRAFYCNANTILLNNPLLAANS